MCVNRLFHIPFLALAGIFMPHSIQAEYVGEMDGFWRRATMVDTHLRGGGGLGIIPGYVTDPGSSFPSIKRPFSTEYPPADSLILVRTLFPPNGCSAAKAPPKRRTDNRPVFTVAFEATFYPIHACPPFFFVNRLAA
jgi:hypothetical protein